MKKQIFSLIFLILFISACVKDKVDIKPYANAEGLSLYWDHEIFNKDGGVLRFEFHETQKFEHSVELIFEHEIKGKEIIITLVDRIDKGLCPVFPSFGQIDNLCRPRGRLRIQDELLENGVYSLILRTDNFEVKSSLIVEDEKFVLDIPPNERFSSGVKEVFPIPKDIIYGSVIFQGEENFQEAYEYFDALDAIGLIDTILPNYPYRHLRIDDSGKPPNKDWEPDNHLIGLLYKMNISFEEIFELSKDYFTESGLDIYLSSSHGDVARLTKLEGIFVHYAE